MPAGIYKHKPNQGFQKTHGSLLVLCNAPYKSFCVFRLTIAE